MSFAFGQSTFGSKPTAFGSPFGPTTTTASGFGSFPSTSFGTPASTTPAFGTSFGAPAATAPPFGSTFGAPGPSTAPTFGTTFGTPSTSAPAFGGTFGATATSAPTFGTTFGAATTSAPSLFGTPATKPSLFGTPASTANLFSTQATTSNLFGGNTTTQAPSLFGTTATPSLFGSTTSAPSLFGGSTFGTVTSSAPSVGLFGATPAQAPAPGPTFGTNFFATAATTSTPSLWGGFGTGTQSTAGGFGGFGTTTFASSLPTTTASSFGGFNLPAPRLTTFATPALPTVDPKVQQVLASIYAINIYGDERDAILKKWNMLQACWGTGKGFYSNTQPPVEYDHTNPFYRFKAVGYSVIPTPENSDGLVKIHFNKKESELSSQKEVLINGIAGILGNKPNLTVNIEHIKAIGEEECEVLISVSEKGVTGTGRKIYASDLSTYLNQPLQKQQLTNVGVTFIGAYMAPTKAQLEEYLKVPPPGIDSQMWQAAQLDNPQPDKYVPVPMFGFGDLKKRMICQEYETGLHRAFLDKTYNEIMEVKRKHALSLAVIAERKQKFLELQHKVLKILVKQESIRKAGQALQPEEEVIKRKLENLASQLSISTQFKGKLQEVMSSVKLMDKLQIGAPTEQYRIDPAAQDDLKQFLQMEQTGIQHLVNIVNKDLKDLKIIQDGLTQFANDNK